ncbi:MAG: hypothetical protein K9J37_15005 [Saprospiraceae bacterium]|nr:hypothetical protein [Saprospiraceae bacterium]MCF8251218.1 hypothetical protein [Saprospiraceae bacterium]MCF8281202.1 hypothetical protein [Bacteroidales bacterium]MCF8313158.1 hypothetical protein [Saprospiraceae bacterium]MCF8441580.1 hypothetical protein [Saprospiraceae bacterium]
MESSVKKLDTAVACIQDILEKIDWSNEQIKLLEQNKSLKKEYPAVFRVDMQNFVSLRSKFMEQLNEIFAQYNLQVKILAQAA